MNAEQRVLIIDSDLKNCKAIKYVLTEYGIGAYYTLSVIDGIERLHHHNYELVILDISPVGNGRAPTAPVYAAYEEYANPGAVLPGRH